MTEVAATKPEAKITKRKIQPWTPKEIKEKFKPLKKEYKKIAQGLQIIGSNPGYIEATKALSQQLLDDVNKYIEAYIAAYEANEPKRHSSIKPRLCDKKLTDFVQRYYKVFVPSTPNGQYGICDLNRIIPRAISIYVKEKGLGETQFFTLDDELYKLFNSYSITNPSKTYLELAQERISEIRATSDYKHDPSSADIITDSGKTIINYSALKILVPKFGIKGYDVVNESMYVPDLEKIAKLLEDKNNNLKELKKASKKSAKAK